MNTSLNSTLVVNALNILYRRFHRTHTLARSYLQSVSGSKNVFHINIINIIILLYTDCSYFTLKLPNSY